jgi:hypothetical protein
LEILGEQRFKIVTGRIFEEKLRKVIMENSNGRKRKRAGRVLKVQNELDELDTLIVGV